MPLDFDALFAPFRVAYFLQWRSIGESLHKVAEWLTRRLETTQERERATRGFQVFDFTGSALSVWIDTPQHGILGPQGAPPPQGFLATAAAPFTAFWRGLLVAPAMIEAEQALPGIVGALSGFVDMVTASIRRFKAPEPGLFAPKVARKWDDLFGELALFFRLANDPATVAQVQTFSAGGVGIKKVLQQHFPPKPKPETAGQSGGLAGSSRQILGATLVIPVATQLVAKLARTVNALVRFQVVDWADSVFRRVFVLRREAIDFLYVTLFGFGSWALETLIVAESDVLYSLRLYLGFLDEYVKRLQAWLTATGKDLKAFIDPVVALLYGLGAYLDTLVDTDFGSVLSLGRFSFKLGDILEWREDPSKAEDVQREIDKFVLDHPFISLVIRARLEALREAVGIAATKTPLPAEAAPPDLSSVVAPRLDEAFLGGGRDAALRKALSGIGPVLKDNIGAALDAGGQALTDLAETMHRAAGDSVRIGSAANYRRIARGAARISEETFGAGAARAAFTPRETPLGRAFGAWLAVSGFQTVGTVLPSYVDEMIRYWKEEAAKPPAERPTSPHIVARRARLGRVRMPRLVVHVAPGRTLDKGLAVEIADRVRTEVAQAFGRAGARLAGAP